MPISFASASPCRDNAFFSGAPEPLLRYVALSLFFVGVIGGLSPGQAQQSDTTQAVQAQDLYRMQEIHDIALSSRGRSVAYTVRRVASTPRESGDSAPSYRTQLYVTRTAGQRAPDLLIRGGEEIRQPAWHPDGTHLAYVQPVEGTPQVFVVPLSGGAPYQLTDTPHGAQRPQWSPDGKRLLFASAVPERAVERQTGRPAPSERPGRSPQDLIRTVPPDTLLVLRHAQTLDPVDTLSFGPAGQIQLRTDSSRALRTPGGPSVPDSLAAAPVDSLALLAPDSLRTVFDRLRLRPDTTTVPVSPDTAATPDGNLVQVRRWLDQNRQPETALVSSRLDLQGTRHLQPAPTYRHHFVVDVPSGIGSGTPTRPEPRPVTTGYRTYGQAKWLPGSGQIVVSGMPPTARHPDRVQQRTLYVVDLTRNRIRRLLRIEDYALTAPDVTEDGTTIAFRARSLSPTSDEQAEIGIFALDGRSQPRFITSTLDRDVDAFRWSPEGWYLYATAPSQGGRPLYRFNPFARDTSAQADQEPTMTPDRPTSRDDFVFDSTMVEPASYKQMTDNPRAVHEFAVTSAAVIYATTDPTTPSALYKNTVSFGNERPLATPNADWLSRRHIATPERMTVTHDSLTITGWMTRPDSSSNPGQRPLLVQVRGGPPELSAPLTPETWFERQYLAGRGLGLLDVYPRGSAGFGTTFRRANDRNWGPGPARDVRALTDSVAALPWVDSTQVALSGSAYGATVATWLLGQTDRFAAAVALNGIYDLPALLDAGQAWRLVPQEFGGYPWEGAPTVRPDSSVLSTGILPPSRLGITPREALHRSSPSTYADQITTPLLLLQGGTDRRVGLSQSERLYKRLKILDRPVEYVHYPGVGHDVSATATPTQRLDRLVRTYEFLARFLDMSGSSGRFPSTEMARP